MLGELFQAVFPGLNRRAKLRAAWGRAGTSDGFRAGRYFALVRGRSPGAPVVDDRTLKDLELPALFKELDTTIR